MTYYDKNMCLFVQLYVRVRTLESSILDKNNPD